MHSPSSRYCWRGVVQAALWSALILPLAGIAQVSQPLALIPVVEGRRPADSTTVIGGQRADPLRYPVSFRLATSPNEICTWFLVSSRTLATAAHCVVANQNVNMDVNGGDANSATGGASYRGFCDIAPEYMKDKSADWALCLLDKPVPLSRDKRIPVTGYEVLNTDASKLKVGDAIEITGFGCRTIGGGVSNVYITGLARVETLPPDAVVPGSTKSSPNLIEIDRNPAILCGGDSGGPAFPAAKDGHMNDLRSVIGINSKTINRDGLGLGYLSAASAPVIVKWIKAWGDQNTQKICGVHAGAMGCRQTE